MAKAKAKIASTKPISTTWLNNAMRSIGVSTKNVIKSEFPNIYETVETGANTTKTVISSLRRNASGTNQLSQQLQNNKYVKFAQTAYKNALSDLKSGNLNNEDRVGDSFMGSENDNVESLLEDSGFSFGDDGADNVNVNIVNASNNEDAVFAMTTQLQKQTEATIKTSHANMNAMIAMNSASMMQYQQTSSLIISGLDAINKNLSALINYNNTSMNSFIQASTAFYEKIGTKLDSTKPAETPEGDKKISANEVLNSSSGGLNFGQYKQYLKQQFKQTLSKTQLGMIDGLLDDNMLQMAAANPLGFATEGLIKFMVPKMLTNTIKGIEETYSSLMPAMLHKLSEWGEGAADGVLGHAKKFIGQIFGLKIERTEKISKGSKIEKGPIPFDGQTKHAITEIITKELREQTSYLSVIAKHFDKKGYATARDNAEVFDSKTGKYIKVSQVTDNIISEINDAVVGAMNNSKFGKTLRGYKDKLTDQNQAESFQTALDEFSVKLERLGKLSLNEKEFNNKDSEYNKLISSLSTSKDIKKYLDNAIREMSVKNPDAILAMSTGILNAQSSRNRVIKDIESNPSDYNLYAARGLEDKPIDELQAEWYKNNANKKGAKINTSKTKEEEKEKKSITELLGFGGKKDEAKSGEAGTVESFLNRTKDGFQKFAVNLIHGSGSEALDAFSSMMKDNFKTIWTKIDDSFLTPFKNTLFGTKNAETGFKEGGVLSGVSNKFKDSAGLLRHYITGKEYKDSSGKVHKMEEGQTSVLDEFKSIGKKAKAGVLEVLFGKDIVDKDGNITGKEGGLFDGFKSSLKNGFQGWKDALFGKKEDQENQQKAAESQILNTIKERLPDAAMGGAIGAGVGLLSGGSLLGTLIGGPIGGAALGTAVGFIAKSEKFQSFLFGEKDDKGNRTGGLISKGVQDYFKKNKNTAIAGAAIGSIGGAITGGGILGNLVGGPIAGALLGMGTSLLIKSDKFQTFLFGEADKDGNRTGGLWGSIKSKVSEFGKKSGDPNAGKLGGMMAIGAAGGGLLGSLFGGPVVGAILGLGSSILAQKDNFHEWFFGKTDEKGNKKEGVLGKFKNTLTVNVLRPMSNMFKDIGSDFKTFLKYDVLERLKISLEPIADTLSSITKKTVSVIGNVGNYIKENFLDGFIEKTGKLLAPLTGVVRGVTKSMYSVAKSIVATPFKLISAITSPFSRAVGKVVTGFAKTAFKGIDLLLVKPIKNLVLKPLALVAKGLGKVVAAPFKLLGKATDKLTKSITGFVDHLGNFTKQVGEELKTFIKNSSVGKWFERRKEDMKEFTQHVKDAAVQFVSPLTDFVKVTIKSVGQHIKESVTSGFKKLMGGLGSLIKKPFELLFGKKDKGDKPKKESTLARIWRETAPGQRANFSTTIDPNASQSEKRRSLKDIIKEENAKNKQSAAERKKLERNEKLIAKYTGNQRADWTEENKRLAEYEAKKKGITINWEDVETRKSKAEEMQDAGLEAQKETSENTKDISDNLKELADFIMGRVKKDPNVVKEEAAEQGKIIAEAIAKRDAEIADQKLDAKTGADKRAAKKAEIAQNDARKKESENRQEQMLQNLAGKDATGLSFAEGLKANWARVKSEFGATSAFNKDHHSKRRDSIITARNEEDPILKKERDAMKQERKEAKAQYKAELAEYKARKKEEKAEKKAAKIEAKKAKQERKRLAKTLKLQPGQSLPVSEIVPGNPTSDAFIEQHTGKGYASGTNNSPEGPATTGEKGKNHKELITTPDGKARITNGPEITNLPKGSRVTPLDKDAIRVVVTGIEGKPESIYGKLIETIKNAGIKKQDLAQKKLDEMQEKGFDAKELMAFKEAEEKKENDAKLRENTDELVKTQKEHKSNWASIFGKKGLITAGLVLAGSLIVKHLPTIIDIAKKILPIIEGIGKGIGSFISGVAKTFGWTMNNNALGDGDTIGDKITQNIDRVSNLIDTDKSVIERIKGFVLNKNNQVDHQSGANAKLLASGTGDALFKLGGGTKRLKKAGISGTLDIIKNSGKITYSVDDVAKALGTTTDDVVKNFGKGQISVDKIAKYMGSSTDEAFDLVHTGLKEAKPKGLLSKLGGAIKTGATKLANTKAGKAVTSAGGAVKATATKLVDNTGSMVKTVISKITTWIDDVLAAIGKKIGGKAGSKLGKGVVKGLLDKVTDVVTKSFSKISSKITAIFSKEGAIAASNAAFGAGVIIKATEITLNAINGATGAARLFQVDKEYVDGKMTTIATVLGAASGTMVGSIIDVVNELFASVTGVDFLSEIATVIYNAWAGEEKAAALAAGKEKFKADYLEYQDKELTKQYETAKKAGLISEDVSYDAYKQGVDEGKYEAKYDSFIDYNDKQHKRLGGKILDTLGKGAKWLGKQASAVGTFFAGKNEKFLEDEKGNKYYDNKDGTYQIISADGEDLGYISKDALPEGLTENKSRVKSIFEKGFDVAKSFIEKKKKANELQKEEKIKYYDNITKALSGNNGGLSDTEYLLKSKNAYVDRATGEYYVSNGTSFDHFNPSGDKIGENISADAVITMIRSDNFYAGTITKDDSGKIAIEEIKAKKKSVFNSVRNAASATIENIAANASNLWNNIKSDGLINGIFKSLGEDANLVWFDVNGNYYRKNGDYYDYYNVNNDLITSSIPASDVDNMKKTGLLTKGTVTTDSVAKKSLETIKSKVSETWTSAKETVSNIASGIKDGVTNAWNSFTSLFTGKKDTNSSDASVGGPRNKPVKGMKRLAIGGPTVSELMSKYTITSSYGNRMINGNPELHSGIDFSSDLNSPVSSFTSGTVYKVVSGATPNSGNLNSTDGGGFGNYVVVKDTNGNYNYYAHMNGTSVKQGDTVQIGDKLGILGHTGRSTGPHLHYEVRKNPNMSGTADNTYDPSAYLESATSNTSGTTSSSSSGSVGDIFTRLSNFFSEFSNRAIAGITTGKWDSNFTSYFANESGDSSTSSTASTDTSSYVKIDTSDNAKKIWNYYKSRGIPDATIAGMLGNIHAESGLNPRNLQNSYEKSLGYTDDSYTAAIDSGKYTNFIKDSAGYGLVQWTYHSLKEALLNYAKKKGSSIGDLDMQLEFLVKQLSEDYPSTWKKMLNASSAEEAAEIMLKEFERPAVLNIATRAGYAKQYYDTLASQNMGASINKRNHNVSKYTDNTDDIGGPVIDSLNYTASAMKEYTSANNANKYISSAGNNAMEKAINTIIGLLEAITGNTASTSNKLDLLENLKKSNIVKGGDTTNNIITNNGNSKSSSNTDILSQNTGKKVSRNQKLAERIALGM